ncbi:hypothetical protein [Euzebyella saccharophila]|uniref:Uncharacterized protein n=1 Tax=Euzebyella saccharophila TaxID=679664 RepID=A0ABV8JRE6_9FLAO|nr:hypothetical protein [Euzebyella saccharophila]
MSRDIRDLLKTDSANELPKMKIGHEKRFVDRLEKEFPSSSTKMVAIWAIAASVLILLGIFLFINDPSIENSNKPAIVNTDKEHPEQDTSIKLGDLSPDLKKIEDYYVANINLELAKLPVSKENEELIEGYMAQLEELNNEYTALSEELNLYGPNDQTITAMIQNLQLRLELLRNLKEELNKINKSKNETV